MEHVVVHKELFETIEEVDEVHVEAADSSMLRWRHKHMDPVDLGSVTMKFNSVSYIPYHHLNTVSCSRLDEHEILRMLLKNYSSSTKWSNEDVFLGKIWQRECDGPHAIKIVEQMNIARVLAIRAIDEAKRDANASYCCLRHRSTVHTNQFTIQRLAKNQEYGIKASVRLEPPPC